MEIGMDVRQAELRQPIGRDQPGSAAVGGFSRRQLATDINRVAVCVGRVNKQHLVVKGLASHYVQILLIWVRVEWCLAAETHRSERQAAVRRAEQVKLSIVEVGRVKRNTVRGE